MASPKVATQINLNSKSTNMFIIRPVRRILKIKVPKKFFFFLITFFSLFFYFLVCEVYCINLKKLPLL